MKPKALTIALIIGLIITTFPIFTALSNAATGNWTLINDGRGVKAYADLKEYFWQKNASMPPNGQYDIIGLHRLVKTGTTTKGVIFILNGLSGSGELSLSNPPQDNWVKNETSSQSIYWANRDFDVYSLDWRTHSVPLSLNGSYLNASQLGFMANWGWDQYISDIKEAVAKTKEISGANKIFFVAYGEGGAAAMNYATLYQSDLRGIVLEDAVLYGTVGSPVAIKRGNETNTYNLTQQLSTMNTFGNWSTEFLSGGGVMGANNSVLNPGDPIVNATPPINPVTRLPWANVTEWWSFIIQTSGVSNLNGGYGNVTTILNAFARNDRFYPARLKLESAAMADWVNCPYLTNDYDDNYSKINVPMLAYAGGKYSNSSGKFQFVNGIANSDFTNIMLPNYGLADLVYGTYSVRDVSQPALDWMSSRYLSPAVLASMSNPSLLTGQTAIVYALASGGIPPYTYQWYEGTNALPGQTNAQLTVTKTTPGTYTFYCNSLDAERTTSVSNTVTLSVALAPTPTPTSTPRPPTKTPTPTPAIPTPTITPTVTPMTRQSPTPQPSTGLPSETSYAVAAIAVIIIVAALGLALKKRAK